MATLHVIDDSPSLHSLLAAKGFTVIKEIYQQQPRLIAEGIKDSAADAILINAEGKFPQSANRQDLKGIELVFWLRLEHKVTIPIILYGFQSAAQILSRHPDKLIIHAPGNAYVQLPVGLDTIEKTVNRLKKNKIHELTETNLRSKYIEFVKLAFKLEQQRHTAANKYGVWYLYQTHKKIDNNVKYQDVLTPEWLKGVDLFQMKIAEFLYNSTDAEADNDVIGNIQKAREKLRRKSPNILYIDDQAKEGWEALLKLIIYGNVNSTQLETLSPTPANFKEGFPSGAFIQEVKNKIAGFGKYDCILLDLRLNKEEGEIEDISTISGIKLLEEIHYAFPSLPVIAFTASNKASSVKAVIDAGADALWTKPGLDKIRSEKQNLSDYMALLEAVENAINKFPLDIEKWLNKADFEIELLLEKESDILSKANEGWDTSLKFLKFADVVVLDMNAIFQTMKSSVVVNYQKAFFLLCLLCKKYKKKLIIIDDVRYELYRKTKKGVQNEKIAAHYSLDKIFRYVEAGYPVKDAYQIIKNSNRNISYSVNKGKDEKWILRSIDQKKVSVFNSKKEAQAEKAGREGRLKSGGDTLHADDTFKFLILHYLSEGKNALFITDDNRCKDEICNILKNDEAYEGHKIFSTATIDGVDYLRDGYVKWKNNKSCGMKSMDTVADILIKCLK